MLAAATQYLDGEDESGLASGLVDTTQQVGSAVVALTRRRADQVMRAQARAGAQVLPDEKPAAMCTTRPTATTTTTSLDPRLSGAPADR